MVTIVYAYRNREVTRIKTSLDSLQSQNNMDFKVVFVDYGSKPELAFQIKELVESYAFANYYYVPAYFLIWNKSKALNYGIIKSSTSYVFIADVDLIFSTRTIEFLQSIVHTNKAYLFKLGYLDKKTSMQLSKPYQFENLEPKHFGTINGMLLVSKEAMEKIMGYDTFFHFYGSEDVDLYNRLSNAGYEIIYKDETYFFHNWHTIFNSYNDKKMSITPLLYNIKRINQEHYFNNKKNKLVVPNRQCAFGEVVTRKNQNLLKKPTKTIKIKNIHSQVHHFFNEELKTYKNEIICVTVEEDINYKSLKYLLKKIFKKQTQPFVSMKTINDIILMRILYNYRDFNYSYQIDKNLKKITFTIKL